MNAVVDHSQLKIGVSQTGGSRLAIVCSLIEKYLADNPRVYNVLMLEIGSYEGVSALHFSHTIGNAGRSGTITCVDPWEAYLGGVGSEHAERMDRELASGDVYQRFIDNCKHEHPNVKLRSFIGTVDTFRGKHGAFDIAYIDGCHRFSACLTDIEAAFKLLKPGGLLCGDDLEKQVESDDEHANAHAEDEYVDSYHPGVSLAVATFFGPPGSVWTSGGVWGVRKLEWKNEYEYRFTAEGLL